MAEKRFSELKKEAEFETIERLNLINKPTINLVSFSGGKDSTAMLLKMIETKIPIDIILFCDTGLEFPQMYEHIDKVEKNIGRSITCVKSERDFEYYLLEHPVKQKKKYIRKVWKLYRL